MKYEQINMPLAKAQELAHMLESKGILKTKINNIINGEYSVFQDKTELAYSLKQLFTSSEYSLILEKINAGYTLEDLQNSDLNKEKINTFVNMLTANNLTLNHIKAVSAYNSNQQLMLSLKNGTDKNYIYSELLKNYENNLLKNNIDTASIKSATNFISNLDYNSGLHKNYNILKNFTTENNLPYESAKKVVNNLNLFFHANEFSNCLDDLSDFQLTQSTKLYRTSNNNYISYLTDDMPFDTLIGQIIDNPGLSKASTISPDLSKSDNVIFEMYAPNGTQAIYTSPFSENNNSEDILLNSNNLYVLDINENAIDKYGKKITIIKSLLLSDNLDCYKSKKIYETGTNTVENTIQKKRSILNLFKSNKPNKNENKEKMEEER